MATLAQSVPESRWPVQWLWRFLKEELAPYHGRAGTVARMTFAATVVMILCLTFQISYGFQGALFALLISREDMRATLQSAGTILIFFGIGVVCLLVSVSLVIGIPVLHFLWVITCLFTVFLALSILSSYPAATMFAVVVAVGVPFWDRHLSAETNVEDTLRLSLGVLVGVIVTVATELAFAHNRAGSDIVIGLAERLDAVRDLMLCYADGRWPDYAATEKIIKLESRGTSILRRILRRSGYVPPYRMRMSGVVSLVGRLVDVAATMTQLRFESAASDRARFRSLAEALAGVREGLVNQRSLGPIQVAAQDETPSGVPLLREMETVIGLIPSAFAASTAMDDYLPRPEEIPPSKLFVPDAFVNPEHLRFAVRGCLAASACYVIYNAIDWPGLSTSVTTCLLTALSTIGASRQKQILRLVGFFIGAVILGMGAQIFILPGIDSIAAFTLLFLFVTVLSAWIMTASPRLSYLGLQLAFGFYYINLVEYRKQISLSIARDRVVGILLGLFMMWLVFDRLGSASAGREMKQSFIGTLRLLARFARAPLSDSHREEMKQAYTLRGTIDASFDKVRGLADGVLFEFGPSRRQDLAFRDCVRQWQPQLRALFLLRISSMEFRLRLPGFELPDSVRQLHREYDDRSAELLDDVANRIEGATPSRERTAPNTSELLDRMLWACSTDEARQFPAARIQSFVNLLRAIDDLTATLAGGITAAF